MAIKNTKDGRGGARKGSGRPKGDRTKTISVRVSLEAYEVYQGWSNKAEVLDALIKEVGKKKGCNKICTD